MIRPSILSLPSMYQSKIFGTSVRPRAPPKADPRHSRPETNWNGRVEIVSNWMDGCFQNSMRMPR